MMFTLLLAVTLVSDPSSWWKSYKDPELTKLVEQALAKNLDVKQATQRIAEARAITGETLSRLFPTINANASTQRLRGGFQQGVIRIPRNGDGVTGGNFVSPFETGIISGGLDTRWELDFFGTNRAALKAARADVVAEAELAQDVALLVSADVARAYIELRGFEDRIAITQRSRDAQKQLLELTQSRAEAGLASQVDVERQASLLATTEASIPPLEAERIVRLNRLAVLLGDSSFASRPLPTSTSVLEVPSVEAGIPSELLKRRPDVRAAEARIAAAAARVKQARTD
ncbi:MAG TPA: TolC family protein, partial [Bryobacteraceae bacterium]|nr:TolC family protein [Bryobacteraceae bacterium]